MRELTKALTSGLVFASFIAFWPCLVGLNAYLSIALAAASFALLAYGWRLA